MAIVRNIQNNYLYRYLGENKYRNLATGTEGIVVKETAVKIFKINVEATFLFEKFPDLEKLVNILNLKFDGNGK